MTDVTQILSQIDRGDPVAAEQLLPLVYDELRRLAAAKLAHERPGQTLSATALVHEAFLRLVGSEDAVHWNSRAHFLGAAAEAMRRILVESARRKKRLKRGGDGRRLELDQIEPPVQSNPDELLAIHDALDDLARHDLQAAEVVKLRFFGGYSMEETARIVGISRSSAYEQWTFARAWLRVRINGGDEPLKAD